VKLNEEHNEVTETNNPECTIPYRSPFSCTPAERWEGKKGKSSSYMMHEIK
jgi:hypothetical protein